tara:strand:- start:1953 stop:2210 length:258 start_codon:yes stop_codon:yes gene_type:complete
MRATSRAKFWFAIAVLTISAIALTPPLLIVMLMLYARGFSGAETVGLTVSLGGYTASFPTLLILALGGAAGFVHGLWLLADARKN